MSTSDAPRYSDDITDDPAPALVAELIGMPGAGLDQVRSFLETDARATRWTLTDGEYAMLYD